jgi:hypothetical protein
MPPPTKPPRWHQANVVLLRGQTKELWQFTVNGQISLVHHEKLSDLEPLPARRVKKGWQAIFQKKLNIAWLPAENVYLRALQLPSSDPAEIRSMIELQLEKISPIPSARAVWTAAAIGPMTNNLQPVVAVILPREEVEAFLGTLEKEGYQTDRLELPLLDQLLATKFIGDGIWIYVDQASPARCLSVWWFQGMPRHISLHAGGATDESRAHLRDQLTQVAWTGEVDGWLGAAPNWRLVADAAVAAEWKAVLEPLSEGPIELVSPVAEAPLAALTARRAVASGHTDGLLPFEYGARYRQQFVDQFWMRGLAAAIGLYLVGLLVYFAAVGVMWARKHSVENQYTPLALDYTNAMRKSERVRVLDQQSRLKFAALECWKQAAELLPKEMSLTSMTLKSGSRLNLYGRVPDESVTKVYDYNVLLSKALINGEALTPETPKLQQAQPDVGGALTRPWDFSCRIGKGDGL